MKPVATFDARSVLRFGLAVLERIRANTLKGLDRFGNAFKPYSSKPFAMPAGALKQKARLALGKDGVKWFRAASGSMWVVITGGYVALKSAQRPSGADVNMSDTGGMLRSMTVVQASATGGVVIGFSRPEMAELAYYHTVSGAGPSRVIRDFLGLPDNQIEELAKRELQGGIQVSVK